MTDDEIAAEIESCRRYLMDSDLDEDAKDALRALLRAARSGDDRAVIVLQVCSDVRHRVREEARMRRVADAAAGAAVAAHAEACAARTQPMAVASPRLAAFRAWISAARPLIVPTAWVVGTVGAAGRLDGLLAFLRALLGTLASR